MDFLKALNKASELGITKEEFLPIYLQEMKDKAAKLSVQNSEMELIHQSRNATESEPVSRETTEYKNVHQHQDWKDQQQHFQRQPFHLTDNFIHDVKSSLDNMKEFLCTEFMNFKQESTTKNELFINVQQDVQTFLKAMHRDIQTLFLDQQDGASGEPDRKDGRLEIYHRALVENIGDYGLKIKNEIQQAQAEIIAECLKQNCAQENAKLMQAMRQEELFMLHGSLIQDNHTKLQMHLQMQKAELSSTIQNLTGLVMGTFNKISEFQNIVCAEMQQQKRNQQLILINTNNACTATAENKTLLTVLTERQVNLQNQSQEQYFQVSDVLSQLQDTVTDTWTAKDANEYSNQEDTDYFEQTVHDNTLNNEPYQEDSEFNAEFLTEDLDTSFESDISSSCGIIYLSYDFCIRNISSLLESRKEFQRVIYDEKLGCCLRASIYLPSEELEDILDITLDMCQVGKDVRLPDLLRISTEISLVDMNGVFSKWTVARENGVFHLPRIQKNGWFEVCSAFLDFKSPEFTEFIENGDIAFNFQIIVFSREVCNIQSISSSLPHSELKTSISHSSDNESTEYFDAEFEEHEGTDSLKLSASLSSGVFEAEGGESTAKESTSHENKEHLTVEYIKSGLFPAMAKEAIAEEQTPQAASHENKDELPSKESLKFSTKSLLLSGAFSAEGKEATAEKTALDESKEELPTVEWLISGVFLAVAGEVTGEEPTMEPASHESKEELSTMECLRSGAFLAMAGEVTTEEPTMELASHESKEELSTMECLRSGAFLAMAGEVTAEEPTLEPASHESKEELSAVEYLKSGAFLSMAGEVTAEEPTMEPASHESKEELSAVEYLKSGAFLSMAGEVTAEEPTMEPASHESKEELSAVEYLKSGAFLAMAGEVTAEEPTMKPASHESKEELYAVEYLKSGAFLAVAGEVTAEEPTMEPASHESKEELYAVEYLKSGAFLAVAGEVTAEEPTMERASHESKEELSAVECLKSGAFLSMAGEVTAEEPTMEPASHESKEELSAVEYLKSGAFLTMAGEITAEEPTVEQASHESKEELPVLENKELSTRSLSSKAFATEAEATVEIHALNKEEVHPIEENLKFSTTSLLSPETFEAKGQEAEDEDSDLLQAYGNDKKHSLVEDPFSKISSVFQAEAGEATAEEPALLAAADKNKEEHSIMKNLKLPKKPLSSGVFIAELEATTAEEPTSLDKEEKNQIGLPPHSMYYFPLNEFSSLIGSESLIDSEDWYLQFLGHSVHAILAFLDEDTMMICLDYFHGTYYDDMPEFAVFKCRVSILDQTDKMEDWVLEERMEIFDLTRTTQPDWMENCVCMIDCNNIKDRFKNNDKIVLRFDFFELE